MSPESDPGRFGCTNQAPQGSPEVRRRLQEMGVREKQKIRLLMRHGSYVCQVCNARLGLSAALADRIMVEASASDQALD